MPLAATHRGNLVLAAPLEVECGPSDVCPWCRLRGRWFCMSRCLAPSRESPRFPSDYVPSNLCYRCQHGCLWPFKRG